MTTTYLVGLDHDSDGAFTDVSADVLALEWRLGMNAPDESVSAPGTAAVTVRNINRAYSPEVNPLSPGTPLRIQSDDGAAIRTHFTGFVSHVEPQPGDQGQRAAVIHAESADSQLRQHRIRLPPQVNVRADTIINGVLDAVPLRRRMLKGRWLIGRVGYSELGLNTRLPGATISRSLETGKTAFAYVGDTWADGVPAYEAIRQITEAECGRFFINREGQAIFFNRHHLPQATMSAATFDNDMDGLHYTYGAGAISQIRVRALPRRLGAEGSVLWMLDTPQRVPPGDLPRRIVARFRDADQRPIGALTLIPPVRGLDFTANADFTGEDLTPLVDVILRAADFSAAALEIRNFSGVPAYLLIQLRGTPLVQGDPITIEYESLYRQALHGLRVLALDLPALDSAEQADMLARYELARRKQPRGEVRTITLAGPPHRAQILARALFDRITIRETQTGHAADYFIVAEAHRVDLGGERHTATWTLESARAGAFWLLGSSRLRRDTIVAY